MHLKYAHRRVYDEEQQGDPSECSSATVPADWLRGLVAQTKHRTQEGAAEHERIKCEFSEPGVVGFQKIPNQQPGRTQCTKAHPSNYDPEVTQAGEKPTESQQGKSQ